MPPLLIATTNQNKLREYAAIFAGLPIELRSLRDLGIDDDVEETGATFAENATLKALAVAAATGELALADDSGLAVDALNGMPGVLSARWSGRDGDDRSNLALVLDQLADVPDERRAARFVCAVALADPTGEVHAVHGEMKGHVIREPLGENGFGYDPIFVPEGASVTSAQLSPTAKDAISHRSRALQAALPLLAARQEHSGGGGVVG